MRKFYNIPLLFLFLAGVLGLFLRWQFIQPTPGIRYTFFLHSHSHVMFLGWVFNVLYLSFAENNLDANDKTPARPFLALQILLIAMMLAFPLQGYGTYSIIFSTLHTFVVLAIIPLFFQRTRNDKRVSTWFARISCLFFFVSSAGPFALGYLMSNDLGHSLWYNFSIYYYLHFQYNGFFFFGVISLFFQMLEAKQINFRRTVAMVFGKLMIVACVASYLLSVLFANPGMVFNIVGAAGALAQIGALLYLLKGIAVSREILRQRVSPVVFQLLHLVLLALVIKFMLQLASAHPSVAAMAYVLRPITIAYLHLVLVGIISIFLLAWYIDRQLVKYGPSRMAIGLFVTGFTASEICLVLTPWLDGGEGRIRPATLIFLFSALMLVGILMFLLSYRRETSSAGHKNDKSQHWA